MTNPQALRTAMQLRRMSWVARRARLRSPPLARRIPHPVVLRRAMLRPEATMPSPANPFALFRSRRGPERPPGALPIPSHRSSEPSHRSNRAVLRGATGQAQRTAMPRAHPHRPRPERKRNLALLLPKPTPQAGANPFAALFGGLPGGLARWLARRSRFQPLRPASDVPRSDAAGSADVAKSGRSRWRPRSCTVTAGQSQKKKKKNPRAPPACFFPPEERYAEQLRQLNDMGFYDFDRNVAALRRSGIVVYKAPSSIC